MKTQSDNIFEIIKSAFSAEVWTIVWPALVDTLYMVSITIVVTLIFGLILGVILVVTRKDGLHPLPIFNKFLGIIINIFRSLPSMILIVLVLPLARLIVGKGYGPDACIIGLIIVCVPMFSRLVESSLLEIPKGKIEAAKAMGTTNVKIVTKVIIPETLPSLIRGFTIVIIAILSTTALAGSFGAGGIGDICIRYGYERFMTDILLATVLVLIVFVQIVQFVGEGFSKLLLKKWHLV